MQELRIRLDDDSILDEEIRKAVKGVTKNLTRQTFDETVKEEMERIANARFERWTKKKGTYNDKPSMLEEYLDEIISKGLKKKIGEINLSATEISKRIDQKFDNLDARIEYILRNKITTALETENMDEKIRNQVEKTVERIVPSVLMDLLAKNILANSPQKEDSGNKEGRP